MALRAECSNFPQMSQRAVLDSLQDIPAAKLHTLSLADLRRLCEQRGIVHGQSCNKGRLVVLLVDWRDRNSRSCAASSTSPSSPSPATASPPRASSTSTTQVGSFCFFIVMNLMMHRTDKR